MKDKQIDRLNDSLFARSGGVLPNRGDTAFEVRAIKPREDRVRAGGEFVRIRLPVRRNRLCDHVKCYRAKAGSFEDSTHGGAIRENLFQYWVTPRKEGIVRIGRDLFPRSCPDEYAPVLTKDAPTFSGGEPTITEVMEAHGHEDRID
jgi:hypothetical protein